MHRQTLSEDCGERDAELLGGDYNYSCHQPAMQGKRSLSIQERNRSVHLDGGVGNSQAEGRPLTHCELHSPIPVQFTFRKQSEEVEKCCNFSKLEERKGSTFELLVGLGQGLGRAFRKEEITSCRLFQRGCYMSQTILKRVYPKLLNLFRYETERERMREAERERETKS